MAFHGHKLLEEYIPEKAKGITIISVTNSNEDWITPFLTTLA